MKQQLYIFKDRTGKHYRVTAEEYQVLQAKDEVMVEQFRAEMVAFLEALKECNE